MKPNVLGALGLLLSAATVLAGCAPASPTGSTSRASRKSNYLPVTRVWKRLPTERSFAALASGSPGGTVRVAPGTRILAYSPPNGFLLMETSGDGPDATQRLLVLDPGTGRQTRIAQANLQQSQILEFAIGSGWVVWEKGLLHGPYGDYHNCTAIYARNLRTGQTETAYAMASEDQVPDFAHGLAIYKGVAYWTNSLEWTKSHDTTTAIYAFDLQRSTLSLIASCSALQQGCYIAGMSEQGGEILYDVERTRQPYGDLMASADVMRYDVATGQVRRVMRIWHGTQYLFGANGVLVMEDNYRESPNSPQDPAPYPWYLYRFGSRTVEQLDPHDLSDFEVTGVSGRFVTATESGQALLIDTKTWTDYLQADVSSSALFGRTLAWVQSGALHWRTLPTK